MKKKKKPDTAHRFVRCPGVGCGFVCEAAEIEEDEKSSLRSSKSKKKSKRDKKSKKKSKHVDDDDDDDDNDDNDGMKFAVLNTYFILLFLFLMKKTFLFFESFNIYLNLFIFYL